jgi:glycosyltransferase involved in cell wall biosynthesis
VTDRKRVFHLIKGLDRGGAEKLLCEFYPCSDRARFHYGYGYFLKARAAMVADLEEAGAEVHCFGSANTASMMLAVARLSRFLRGWRADLLHCHLPLAGVVGRIAGKMVGIPVLYTEHNLPGSYALPTRLLNLATWPMQQHVFAVSDAVHSSIVTSRLRGVPVRVVQNGVCTEKFSPAAVRKSEIRERLGIAASTTVVGTVAGFRRQKRLDIWLEAASLVHQHDADVCFLLVGDGRRRPEVEQKIDELDLGEITRLVGVQEDVAPYLEAMDIYLMSSDFEGLPVALLEAMSMQLPVVTTPVGGIRETVVDGRTGVLVPTGDAAALASVVLELIADQDRRQAMGNAGRERVREHFSLARAVRETESVYTRVLQQECASTERNKIEDILQPRDMCLDGSDNSPDRNARL